MAMSTKRFTLYIVPAQARSILTWMIYGNWTDPQALPLLYPLHAHVNEEVRRGDNQPILLKERQENHVQEAQQQPRCE